MCRPKSLGGMGFRELQKFNDAMLGKQIWRLLKNQDSLFFKFFKTKFFPHGNIFYAKGNKGSFAWRSILKGREVIRRGLKWRIGNGSKVRIYCDAWLPGSRQDSITSPVVEGHADSLVCSLINHESMCWKEDDIDRIFVPEEAAIIKAIPLSLFNRDDTPYWPHNRDGVFLVRSGYQLLLDLAETEMEVSSNAGDTPLVWKAIWSLRVPNRFKSLLWRAGNDSVPTQANLVKRKVLDDALCQECKLHAENTLHAIWSCPKLINTWNVHFTQLKADTVQCASFLEVIDRASLVKTSFELFAMAISAIWMWRNKVRLGETTLPLGQIPASAFAVLQEFQHLRPTHAKIPRTACAVRWRPPPETCVKANFDEAVFAQERQASIGIIIRNAQGLVMAALSQQIPLPTSGGDGGSASNSPGFGFCKGTRF